MLAEAVQAEEMLGGHERKVLELQEAIPRLERDPAFAACSEMEQQIRALEAERAEMVRRSAGVTLPAMQVLRKVEKIAGKRQDRIIRDKVRRLRDLLADLPAGQETERDALLLDVMPSVLDLIREGELTLKNKEEQHLFSDDQTLRNELSGIAALFRDVDDRLSRTRSRLADTPVLLERERLIMELEECRRRQQALQAALEESRQQIEKMSHTFADLTERLHERTKDLDDRDIAVSVEMLPAYAGHGAA
ncbi:pneumococcal surface protein [hydrocarbon metagenome]|uniref:Pneumococcal surface protein n=1 Tax=hydrocarbon metagenome TaxID=938273 RepID=A0A0W8FK17_9ZZZZ